MAAPSPTLLGIPRELRESIYSFVLMETPLLHRRHHALCTQSQLDSTQPEEPPCQLRPPSSQTVGLPCACAKRKHLSLLLVSRQVHSEAAPMLWAHNIFTFLDPSWLTSSMGKTANAPEGFREFSRHIVCLTPAHFIGSSSMFEEAWRGILACRALQRLEVGCGFLENGPGPSYLAELRTGRPHMTKITLITILPQRYTCEGRRLSPRRIPIGRRGRSVAPACRRNDPACMHTGNLYVVVSHEFTYDVILSAEGNAAAVRWYADSLLPQITPAFRWLMRHGCPGEHLPLLALGLCDTSNETTLRLEGGVSCPATVLGLPNGAETSMQNRVEREKQRKRRYRQK